MNESFGTLKSNRGIQQGYGRYEVSGVPFAQHRARAGAPPRPASGRHRVRVRREPRRA
ncbi:protein of unknown function [Methylocella tundrae]|uniref:Uncharacterized protein n=1 Tax=Methylocella tundrae TaxID=227605 RepID=A0A4U8Z297_METTU|nr:protein of unknown function [Methylocella tundrae]